MAWMTKLLLKFFQRLVWFLIRKNNLVWSFLYLHYPTYKPNKYKTNNITTDNIPDNQSSIITPVAPFNYSALPIIPDFKISKNLNKNNANIFKKGEASAIEVAISCPENSSTITSLGSFLLQVSKYNFVATSLVFQSI